jgi:DNA-binding GntR family transcriptional regulator
MSAGSDQDAAPIARATLHDEITARLRDMIIEGQIEAGHRINEVHLGKSLGVSRTPLREALKTLASDGLVELVPNRGAFVRVFALDEIVDMLEALRHIEKSCAVLACNRVSAKEIREFKKLHLAMIKEYKNRHILNYFKINQKIHEMLVNMSGNATLCWMHRTVSARLRRIRFLGVDAPAVWALAIEHHEAIMAALEARDGPALANVVSDHMDLTVARIRTASRGAYL